MSRTPWSRIAAATATVLALVAAPLVAPFATAPAAEAAGTPDITLEKSMPETVLYGENIPVTLTASNDTATDGYNLGFVDVLPPNVGYANAQPAPDRVVNRQNGETVLIWDNVADLLSGTEYAVSYEMVPDTTVFGIGAVITNDATAVVNSNPRLRPRFTANGVPVGNSVSGSAEDSAQTQLIPFDVQKSEPSPEAELLRGVHDHQTVYTISVENNALLPSTGFSLVDYLPAGLEFLQCGAVDNSAEGTEEYPDSGRMDVPPPALQDPCVTPTSVTTVQTDPDGSGPLAAGVYTRVEWDAATLAGVLGSIAPGATARIQYVAAIPLRENVLPGDDAFVSTANLDNNTGPLTTDEQELTNGVVGFGTTGGNDYQDWGRMTVSAEDIAIQKGVTPAVTAQGGISTWTLDVQTSEYALSTNGVITVTDTLPAALDYTATTTGPAPVSVTTPGDGTQVVTWELPATEAPNQVAQIVFTTTTREQYRDSEGFVSANDSWTNQVDLAAQTNVITDNDATTSDLPIVDDSSASQSTAPVMLDKQVSNPLEGATQLDCDTATYAVDDAQGNNVASGPYRPGDRVCWQLTVRFPQNLDTVQPRIRDFLPDGFDFVDYAFTDANTIPEGDVVFTNTEPVLSWEIMNVGPGGVFQVVVDTVITEPAGLSNDDILTNLIKLSYRNTAGDRFQLRDSADAPYIEPTLAIDKDTTATTVQGGDVVPYTVTVRNTGGLQANDVSVRDVLPAGIVCDDVTDLGGAECTDVDGGRSYLQWPGQTVAVDGSVTLSYEITMPDTYAPGATLTNTAGVRAYTTETNTGTPFTHVPSNNIDPTLEPQANDDPLRDDAQVRIIGATAAKTQVTSVTEAGNDGPNQATIGEEITYTVTGTVPDGVTIPNGELRDSLPTGLEIVGTPTATYNGGQLPDGFSLQQATRAVFIDFPDSYTNAGNSGDDTFVITLTVRVTDVTALQRGATRTNSAALTWTGGSSNTARTTVTIVEPLLSISKSYDDADGQVTPGQTVNYSIGVANGAPGATNVSTAHDLEVVDTLPIGITPLGTDGEPVTGDAPVQGGGQWSQSARTITWTIPSLAPGASTNLAYLVRVDDPVVASASLRNEVEVTGTSLAGDVDGERDGAATEVPGYAAEDDATITAPTITLTKDVTPTSATIGEVVTYTVSVTVPANVIAYDAIVFDELPDGVAFRRLVDAACAGCNPQLAGPVNAISNTGDEGTIGFFVGDIAESAAERTLVITYEGYATTDSASGDTKTNTAQLLYDLTDRVESNDPPETLPDRDAFDTGSNTDDATVGIVEPVLVLNKVVDDRAGNPVESRRAVPGDVLTYTVTVTNTGNAPAYDVVVSDTPTTGLDAYTDTTDLDQFGGVEQTDATYADGTLSWTVPGPIAPNETVTITYTLTVPADWDESDEVVDGPEIVNTASSEGYGLPEATRDEEQTVDYPTYESNDDTVEVEVDLASIGDTVWFDVNGDGFVDPGEPLLAGVTVTVTYYGADGVLGGGDDEVFTDVTDANGVYLVEHLPGGRYSVVVSDDAGTPIAERGLTPSYDLDGGLATPDGEWVGDLGEDEAKRDVDFGYRGTGSIGDTVWFDQNANGELDGTEIGIPGASVTLTWYGPDGVAGGGDDVVYPTATTDEDGLYRFDGLPAGTFGVQVVLPEGIAGSYEQVSGPDGEELDGTSTVTIAQGGEDLDQDFGYAGTGSIGDTIYLDRDGDGVQGDDEPGLVGVTVQLVFTDEAGNESTYTTTTGPDGAYLFDNLPAGEFTVTVVGGLPANVENTGDPDSPVGEGDSTSSGTLANGQDDLDQDFGYFAESVLGDFVWWDLNGDGVQDPGEPGIPGVTVTATGPNGVTLTTTTDADGGYLFSDIPSGDWTVTLSGVPAGFTATYDADGGLDGSSTTTLEVSDLEQDFGYTGAGSIGDYVWLDRNGDGVQDADEVPLADVTVTLTWAGADGELGTDDDIQLTTVTDANGGYLFDHLPLGDFRVDIDPDTLPEGAEPTFDLDGIDETPNRATVTLTSEQPTRDDVDFGYRGDARIGDTIWLDQDSDGVVDEGEPGIADVTVTLVWAGPDGELGTDDDQTFTTVTDVDGQYAFDFLPAGEYRVIVDQSTLPGGLVATYDEDGTLDSSTDVTLAVGDDHDTADFGYVGAGQIGDTIYLDLDGDGVQGDAEPGVPGQRVDVVWFGPDGEPGTDDDVTFERTTDENGQYSVVGLPDGSYSVTVVGGIVDTAVNTGDPEDGGDSTSLVTLGGESPRVNLDQDFGYQGLNSLGDTIWVDANDDGIDDAGEPRLPGVSVVVTWFGPDGEEGTADDVVLPTAVTDENGNYLVSGLPDGTFSVVVTDGIPAGLVVSVDPDGGLDGRSVVSLEAVDGVGEANLDQDFGYVETGSIGDFVWHDEDRDGQQDAGEPGIGGVTVELIDANGDVIATTVTDEDGRYLFDDVRPGDYTVRIDLSTVPDGYRITVGTNEISVTVGPGEDVLTVDFPLATPAAPAPWLPQTGQEPQYALLLTTLLLLLGGAVLLVTRRRREVEEG